MIARASCCRAVAARLRILCPSFPVNNHIRKSYSYSRAAEPYCMLYRGAEEDDGTALLSLTNTALPESLAPGEVLGRILLATICGSDLHTFAGTRKEATPSVLGHEAISEVVRSNRDGVSAGQRVTFSVASSCTECRLCRIGLPQKCTALVKYGHCLYTDSDQLNGCYASHILLRSGTPVVPIPASLSNATAAPLNCALATMVHAVDRIEHLSPTTASAGQQHCALVQGAGLLGVYGVALLKQRGFTTVYCSDVDRSRLATVERFGATPVLIENADSLRNVVQPSSMDAVFEVCGQKSVLADGLHSLRCGGSYVLVGMVHPDSALPFTAEDIVRKCATVVGVHNYNEEHLRKAVQFLDDTASVFPYGLLVSPPYKLSELLDAIAAAKTQQFHRVSLQP